jgi:hypothetical protein
MGFFTDDELANLRIERMNFQIVGQDSFAQRPAMRAVEQPDFFLGRILEIDIGAAFSFDDQSKAKELIEKIARGRATFPVGAVSLAQDFDSRHVGQSKPGAFFFFQLAGSQANTQLYAMLKYDYSEVLTLRKTAGSEQLRRIVQAFVKDKRALQKSALVRVVDGVAEALIAVKDRAAKSPDITDFFSKFLGVSRTRDDVELNKEAAQGLAEIAKQAPQGTWPQGEAAALRAMREALRLRTEVSIEAVQEVVFAAAGQPQDEAVAESLERLAERVWRRRRLSGLGFRPDPNVFRVASSRRVRTVEHIKIEYPEALEGVKVRTESTASGGAVITIETAGIESVETVNESLSHIRRQLS